MLNFRFTRLNILPLLLTTALTVHAQGPFGHAFDSLKLSNHSIEDTVSALRNMRARIVAMKKVVLASYFVAGGTRAVSRKSSSQSIFYLVAVGGELISLSTYNAGRYERIIAEYRRGQPLPRNVKRRLRGIDFLATE